LAMVASGTLAPAQSSGCVDCVTCYADIFYMLAKPTLSVNI